MNAREWQKKQKEWQAKAERQGPRREWKDRLIARMHNATFPARKGKGRDRPRFYARKWADLDRTGHAKGGKFEGALIEIMRDRLHHMDADFFVRFGESLVEASPTLNLYHWMLNNGGILDKCATKSEIRRAIRQAGFQIDVKNVNKVLRDIGLPETSRKA